MTMTRETCKRCGRENPLGFNIPDDIWKAAISPQWRDKTLCILCFDELATYAGVKWDESKIEFYPVSGITAIEDGLKAYGFEPQEWAEIWAFVADLEGKND